MCIIKNVNIFSHHRHSVFNSSLSPHCVTDMKETAPFQLPTPMTLPTKHLIISWFRPQQYGLPSKINITTAIILSFVEHSSWIYCSAFMGTGLLGQPINTPQSKYVKLVSHIFFCSISYRMQLILIFRKWK